MKKKIKNKKNKNILLLFGLLPIMVVPLALSVSCSQNATTNSGFNKQKLEEVSNDINNQIVNIIKDEPLYFDSENIKITEIKEQLDLKLKIDKNHYGYDLYDLVIDKTNNKLKVNVNVFDLKHPSFPKVIENIELPYIIVSPEEKLLKENADDFEKQVLEMKYYLIVSSKDEINNETVQNYLKENTNIDPNYDFNVEAVSTISKIQNGKFNVTINFYSMKNNSVKEQIRINDLNYEIASTDEEKLKAYANNFKYQILAIKSPLKVKSTDEIGIDSVTAYISENTKINSNYKFNVANVLITNNNKFDTGIFFRNSANTSLMVELQINSLTYQIG